MSDDRGFRWATTGARLLAGTLGTVAFVVGVVTAVSVPWPTLVTEPLRVAATPTPAASVVACDGGLLALGREIEQAGRLVTAAEQSVIAGAQEGREAPGQGVLTTSVEDALSAPAVVSAEPQDRTRTDVAASGAASVSADDLRGFAASACRPPLAESWLVGGSAATGAADLVLLANPGSVPAVVQLTVFGASGPQTPPGGVDLVVAPNSQTVVPLAGLLLGEESPVVRVTAAGAPVQAALQASITRTLVPGGVDQVGAIALPETRQIIPGVAVTRTPGEAESSFAASVVRVLSPASDASATVTVTAVGATGPTATISVPLVGGIPTEVALGTLPVGTYTVEVTSEAAVLAAVWQSIGSGAGADFAWYTPAPAVSVPSLFAAPTGPAPQLTIVNPGDLPVNVRVTATDGSFDDEVSIEPGAAAALPLGGRTVYALDPGGADIRAALSLTGDGALAGFPVWSSDAVTAEITVYP